MSMINDEISLKERRELAKSLFKYEDGRPKIDYQGHDYDGSISAGVDASFLYSLVCLSSSGFKKLWDFLEKPDTPIGEWLKLYEGFRGCQTCGADRTYLTNGHKVKMGHSPCPYPNGFPFLQVDIDVPSGKICVADDLRMYFGTEERVFKRKGIDFDTLPGRIDTNKDWRNYSLESEYSSMNLWSEYAKDGLACGLVMNTCPGLHKKHNEDVYFIGNPPCGVEEMEGCAVVAKICTNLWWFCIADYDLIMKNKEERDLLTMKEFGYVWDEEDDWELVDLTPGVYRMTYFAHHMKFHENSALDTIYAGLHLIKAY